MTGEHSKRPTKAQYRLAAMEEAAHHCPPIYPCGKCGWPVIKGYCCGTCGDDNPETKGKRASLNTGKG